MLSPFFSSGSPNRISRRFNKSRPQKIVYKDPSSASPSDSSSISANQWSSSALIFPSTVQAQTPPVISAFPLYTSSIVQPSAWTRFKASFSKSPESYEKSFFPKIFRTKENGLDKIITSLSVSSPASGFCLFQAAIIFKIIVSIGDGAANVPDLNTAAQVAKEIEKIAQVVIPSLWINDFTDILSRQ